MKVLIAIALLSVASALPRPDVSDIDFRPLMVPKEIIEAAEAMNKIQQEAQDQDSGIAVNFVDNVEDSVVVADDAGVKINFVDSATNEVSDDAGTALNFVDSPVDAAEEAAKELDSDDGVVVLFVDNADDGVAVNFVDSPVETPADDAVAVNFVDSPVETHADDAVAVNFVDSPVETPADDAVAVNFVDYAPNAFNVADVADRTAINFVDSPLNQIPQDSLLAINFVNLPLEANAGAFLIVGNVFEPISASELEAIRVVDMPVPVEEIRRPGKVFDNPLLR